MDIFFWNILFVQQLVVKATIPMKKLLFLAIINIVLLRKRKNEHLFILQKMCRLQKSFKYHVFL